MTLDDLRIGDVRVWPGQGIVRVTDVVDRDGTPHALLTVRDGAATISAPVTAGRDETLRLPTDRAAADRAWADLLVPAVADDRPWPQCLPEIEQALLRGSVTDQVRWLRALYAIASPSTGQFRMRSTLEDVLLSELAETLGRDVEQMRTEVRERAASG